MMMASWSTTSCRSALALAPSSTGTRLSCPLRPMRWQPSRSTTAPTRLTSTSMCRRSRPTQWTAPQARTGTSSASRASSPRRRPPIPSPSPTWDGRTAPSAASTGSASPAGATTAGASLNSGHASCATRTPTACRTFAPGAHARDRTERPTMAAPATSATNAAREGANSIPTSASQGCSMESFAMRTRTASLGSVAGGSNAMVRVGRSRLSGTVLNKVFLDSPLPPSPPVGRVFVVAA
mmetsp:Transcript_28896/g.59151  ORF Transcript_28896/g.59151 Transcript_28896/m.59151 type:complete len:238 (-) Transcript_28896:145-858(-)